jgi:serine/threonine-protein kinase
MTASGDSSVVQTAPRAIGRYQLLEPLGRGGMGTVYRARQVQLEKLVAVKVLDPLIASGQAGVTRFLREARAAAKIRHPNVVEVFDVGFDEGAAFLAMELLEGQDLAALLRFRQRLPLHEIVEIFAPVLAGVRAAHEAGVVHRDLKPSNIFLARRGRTRQEPIVLDFGVSRVLLDDESGLTPVTSSETMIGTAAYIAPEQARQARLADDRSDQYSLGVILYECATGARPFEGQSTYEILHSIATATVAPPSQRNPVLPSAFDELVLRTLARDPNQRFDDLDGLARALMAFAAPRTWMAWGRELVATDLADGDDSSTRPPSQPFAAEKSALSPALLLARPKPRWRGHTLAFALGALLSASALALVRQSPSAQPPGAQPLSTQLQATLSATAALTPLPEVSPSASAALPDKVAVSKTNGSPRVAMQKPFRALARATAAGPAPAPAPAPALSASSHVEMGQNDAPIIK